MQGSPPTKEKKYFKRNSRGLNRESSVRSRKEDQVHSSHPTQSNGSNTNKPKMLEKEISLSVEKEILSFSTEKEPSSPRDSENETKRKSKRKSKRQKTPRQKIEKMDNNSDLYDQIENNEKRRKTDKHKTDKIKRLKEQQTPKDEKPTRPKTNQEIPKIPFESTLENSESPNPSTPQLLSLNESDGDILVSTVMKDFSNCPDTIIQYLHSKKKHQHH